MLASHQFHGFEDEQHGCIFENGSSGDVEKLLKFFCMQASTAFSNVIGNGKACSTNLLSIAVEFALLKVISHFMKTD